MQYIDHRGRTFTPCDNNTIYMLMSPKEEEKKKSQLQKFQINEVSSLNANLKQYPSPYAVCKGIDTWRSLGGHVHFQGY